MSLLALVIDRLRAEVPGLRAVQGAADLASVLDQRSPPQSPSAWVIPVSDTGGANALVNVVSQALAERVGVVVAQRNVADPRAEHAVLDVKAVIDAIRAALVGWAPEGFDPVLFVSGRLTAVADGTVWWTDEFRTESELRAT